MEIPRRRAGQTWQFPAKIDKVQLLRAQAEYNEALPWYETRNPRAATRFEAEVERLLESIAANPEMFAWYDDEHRFAILRRFPYSIVYQVQASHPFVVAVPHTRRRSGYWEGRT